MALTTITKSNLESAPYNNLLEIFDNRDNIADPRTKNGDRDFIYDSDPLEKGASFSETPYIVLELPTHSSSNKTCDAKHEEMIWTYTLIIRTKKDGSGGANKDTGRGDLLAIADDLNETCNSRVIEQSLNLVNMPGLAIEKLSSDTIVINQDLLYEGRYEITHKTRLKVSD